jgi:hypothetical protein
MPETLVLMGTLLLLLLLLLLLCWHAQVYTRATKTL